MDLTPFCFPHQIKKCNDLIAWFDSQAHPVMAGRTEGGDTPRQRVRCGENAPGDQGHSDPAHSRPQLPPPGRTLFAGRFLERPPRSMLKPSRRCRVCMICPFRMLRSALESIGRNCSGQQPTAHSKRPWISGAPAGSGLRTCSSKRHCPQPSPLRMTRPALPLSSWRRRNDSSTGSLSSRCLPHGGLRLRSDPGEPSVENLQPNPGVFLKL